MPIRHVEDCGVSYCLVLLDKEGRERPEQDGALLSTKIRELVEDGVTDLFIASHGWMGDVPAANHQYDAWVRVMAKQSDDRALARRLDPQFKSLVIGIHWPSLPWGDERAETAVLGAGDDDDELAYECEMSAHDLVDRYAQRIVDTRAARSALQTIVAAADNPAVAEKIAAGTLPPELDAAYLELFAEAGLKAGGVTAPPGADQEVFKPLETAREWLRAVKVSGPAPGGGGDPGVLGVFGRISDAVLGPVRQISFWTMKNRARIVGERDVHHILRMMQDASDARIHLMGHSFGCIVMTAATAGPTSAGQQTDPLPRPVDTLFLVQGAMSLWSFAEAIPYPPGEPGYFRVLCQAPRRVAGPIVATNSRHDRAVGTFYPLGSRLGSDRILGYNDFPEYGGIGSFGVQGTEPREEMEVLAADATYRFAPGTTYNIEASRVIASGSGLSGAHSDIVHDEIAHIFWQAALSNLSC
ncbi:hypothetical protein [Mycobacterium sp. 1274756.6]|uniref:hypothetical protein n=1 Tax=Mycobacterium sp. 1274756.6 TaxID=1834076 RepID=UPI00080011A5|nr:hypothetical protein [Mycobacterium sp. 1274756.6]OBJ70706.1 hypothetical protein A5643_10035 [Mycobacterium sp. 1274756.6]